MAAAILSTDLEQPLDQTPTPKPQSQAPVPRQLDSTRPYVSNHIVHHQPYYASGYSPYHSYGPLTLAPPSPMLAMPPMVPPPPPIFTSGQLPIQNAYHVIHHPQHNASPWNVNAYPHVFNPYLGHGWPVTPMHPSAYSGIPHGLHPFSYPGVGFPYGMSPYYNPYMSMMDMGSIHPFLGASMYPTSHIAGGYGMHGPSNPLNIGETANVNGGTAPGEERPMNDAPTMGRKLTVDADNGLVSADEKDRALEDLETSKQRLIETLQESLKQLKSV